MNLPRRPGRLSRASVLRRLGLFVAAGPCATFIGRTPVAANVPSACTVTPAETEGPFFIDHQLERSDLRTDPGDGSRRPGVPMQLTIVVHQTTARGCLPLPNATVDIWHADAFGSYSGETGNNDPARFLRGYQRTDHRGLAAFTTIFPGWYAGRTVHIHFKVRTNSGPAAGYEFTSQLYFDDAFTDVVYRRSPYAGRGPREVRNEADGIFTAPPAPGTKSENGTALMLPLVVAGDGYAARFEVALDLSKPALRDHGPDAPPGGPGPAFPPR